METLRDMTDEMLVERYSCGENAAFDILLARHQQSIFNSIYFTIRDQSLAEDIFQEAFIKAITNIRDGKYTHTGKFKAWVARIAHNLTIDHFRRVKTQKTISNDDSEVDLFNNQELCDQTIEDKLIEQQINQDIRMLINELPDNQKEVLIMRYYQDLSFKEIADKTDVSINTALGRMRYALINIRKLADERNISLTID